MLLLLLSLLLLLLFLLLQTLWTVLTGWTKGVLSCKLVAPTARHPSFKTSNYTNVLSSLHLHVSGIVFLSRKFVETNINWRAGVATVSYDRITLWCYLCLVRALCVEGVVIYCSHTTSRPVSVWSRNAQLDPSSANASASSGNTRRNYTNAAQRADADLDEKPTDIYRGPC